MKHNHKAKHLKDPKPGDLYFDTSSGHTEGSFYVLSEHSSKYSLISLETGNLYMGKWLKDIKEVFSGYDTYFVKVKITSIDTEEV